MIFIEDVGKAMLRISENPCPVSGQYDLAFPEPINFIELIKKASDFQKKKIKLNFTGKPSDFPFELNSDQLINANETWAKIGYQPEYDLTKGLERTYKWWKGNA